MKTEKQFVTVTGLGTIAPPTVIPVLVTSTAVTLEEKFVWKIGTEQTALIIVTTPPRIIPVTTKAEEFASKIGTAQIAQNFVTQLRTLTAVWMMVK